METIEDEETNLAIGCIVVLHLVLLLLAVTVLCSKHFQLLKVQKKHILGKMTTLKIILSYTEGAYAIIFSKRFYTADESKFLPDQNGSIDMSEETYAKPGYMPFYYGYSDQTTERLLHANEGGSEMVVYSSTLDYYSKRFRDFNRQVFFAVFVVTNRPEIKL
ncbi:MAG: hypothetical protein ACJAUD_000741 [Crocinitomicaceae bacterium]|jgi:hypothetical protein